MPIINDIVETLAKSGEMAEKAKVSVDQLSKVAKVLYDEQATINASRRSSPDDREAIDACMRALDGELKDLSPSDILSRANVARKQGTMSYAARQKRLLLTHQAQ